MPQLSLPYEVEYFLLPFHITAYNVELTLWPALLKPDILIKSLAFLTTTHISTSIDDVARKKILCPTRLATASCKVQLLFQFQ